MQLKQWLGNNADRWLSYMVNNNPRGVLTYLQSKGATIQDTNANGSFETDELYAALRTYAIAHFGSVKAFVNASAPFIAHNYDAPRRWNLYK